MKAYGRLIAIFAALLLIAGTAMPTLLAIDRYSGQDRYDTAVEISKSGWEDGAVVVVLARGDVYADALAGVPLAYANSAPILLTKPNQLPSVTKAEIDRLDATKVYILGGLAAVSQAVEDEIAALGIEVVRISGENRFATAAAIADEVAPDGAETVFLAYGMNFPDALAAASYAAASGSPILLTLTDELPAETIAALEALDPSQVFVIGGTTVISDAVMNELTNPERISGSDRYATAVALAERFAGSNTFMFIASGTDKSGGADAITGAALAASMNSGILLVDNTLPDEVVQFLQNNIMDDVYILGGRFAVSEDIGQELEDYLSVPSDPTPYTPPSIVRVSGVCVSDTTTVEVTMRVQTGLTFTWNGRALAPEDITDHDGIKYVLTVPAMSSGQTNTLVISKSGYISYSKLDIVWTAAPWDGTVTEGITPNGDLYEIKTAGQLAWLAAQVNSGQDFSGKTVKLLNDIDLNEQEWTPIGAISTPFRGVFDGNGKTIDSMTITHNTPADLSASAGYGGLFGHTNYNTELGSNAQIIDLVMTNVNIDLNMKQGYAAAALVGKAYDTNLTNITVSGTINCDYLGAGIVLVLAGTSDVYIENCVSNIDISAMPSFPDASWGAYYIAGGIIGQIGGTDTDVTFYVANCHNHGDFTQYNAYLPGSEGKTPAATGDSYSRKMLAGQIIGQTSSTSYDVLVSDCTGTGTITAGHMLKYVDGTFSTIYQNGSFVGQVYTSATETADYGYTVADMIDMVMYGGECYYIVDTLPVDMSAYTIQGAGSYYKLSGKIVYNNGDETVEVTESDIEILEKLIAANELVGPAPGQHVVVFKFHE